MQRPPVRYFSWLPSKTTRSLKVNIVAVDNGAGLTVDVRLLTGILETAGMEVTWSQGGPPKQLARLTRVWGRRWPVYSYDINLFLERITASWLPLAAVNAMIPNPEWFPVEQTPLLAALDVVLCKTWDAEQAFAVAGARALWMGFTAGDRFGGAVAASQPLRVLHLAGRSPMKGTRQVLEAWARHPEWPELTVVRRPLNDEDKLDLPELDNVRYVRDRISDQACLDLQASHSVYLLPSEAEGYGQALVEGLSAGAVVVTTDGPPMNEIVVDGRGVLVAAKPGGACGLGRLYQVTPDDIELAMTEVFSWSLAERIGVGNAARAWFLSNDARFRLDLPRLLSEQVLRAGQ